MAWWTSPRGEPAGSFSDTYNIVVSITNREDSGVRLLRVYLDAVTLSEALQTSLWHAAELTLAQVRTLRRLARQPQSLGQLGSELALAPPSMTRVIDRLEERGLIERRRDADDRRKVVATVTDEGRRLVSAVVPFLEGTAIRTAVERMSVADQNRIAAAMRDFNSAVRKVEDELLMTTIEA
jgi:DNA-binding MarR family transcriptional regulator